MTADEMSSKPIVRSLADNQSDECIFKDPRERGIWSGKVAVGQNLACKHYLDAHVPCLNSAEDFLFIEGVRFIRTAAIHSVPAVIDKSTSVVHIKARHTESVTLSDILEDDVCCSLRPRRNP